MTITVPASREVERLIGRRIPVSLPDFEGFGTVTSVMNYGGGDFAELELTDNA